MVFWGECEKKFTKNRFDNQSSYKKVQEKDKKKFGRIKKVRTFAIANETGTLPEKIARVD